MVSKKYTQTKKALFALFSGGLVIALLYFYFIDPYTSRFLQAHTGDVLTPLPNDLQDASFLLGTANRSGLYEHGRLTFHDYEADGSLVLELQRILSTEAKLLYRQETGLFDIVINGNIVASSKDAKRSLSLSSDASYVAYVSCDATIPVAGPKSVCARASVINLKTFEAQDMGPAAAVAFVGVQSLVYLREEGAYIKDLVSGVSASIIEETPPFISNDTQVSVSPDGTKIAWAMGLGAFQKAAVYDLTEDGWRTSARRSIEGITGTILLTNEHLYELVYTERGARLLQHSLESNEPPRFIRMFPQIISPSQIIL